MTTISLTIIHTTDLHAHIDGLAKTAGYLNEARQATQHVLYLDAGDIFSGHPVVDLKHGKPMVELLNAMHLDAMAIGNHDFDYGAEHFVMNQQTSTFPWIAANVQVVDETLTPIRRPKPYQIFDFGDLLVGVVAITQAPPATQLSGIRGLEFADELKTLQQYEYLRDDVDVLIALTHVGDTLDRQMAEQLSRYHIIIGGHSHNVVEMESINGIRIVNTGAFGEVMGDLTVQLEKAGGAKITKIDSQLIRVDTLTKVDEEVQSLVQMYVGEAEAELSKEIGV